MGHPTPPPARTTPPSPCFPRASICSLTATRSSGDEMAGCLRLRAPRVNHGFRRRRQRGAALVCGCQRRLPPRRESGPCGDPPPRLPEVVARMAPPDGRPRPPRPPRSSSTSSSPSEEVNGQ